MMVSLTKHGGIGAIRWPARSIDTSNLSPDAVADLERLIKAAEAEASGAPEASARGRDTMSYAVTIEERGRSRVLRRSDATLTPAFAALVDWIERMSSSV